MKNGLEQVGLWSRLEYSLLHRMHTRLLRPEKIAGRKQRLKDHQKLINHGQLVFDVGANIGEISLCCLELGCRVIAVEPDERCGKILRKRFGRHQRFVLEPVAVSDKAGTAEFHVQTSSSAYNTLSTKWRSILETPDNGHAHGGMKFAGTRTVPVVTIDALIAKHGAPDFLKVDVEGYEAQALAGLTKRVKLLMFEANLPEFHAETLQCIQHLTSIDPAALFQVTLNGAAVVESSWHDAQSVLPKLVFAETFPADVYCKMNP